MIIIFECKFLQNMFKQPHPRLRVATVLSWIDKDILYKPFSSLKHLDFKWCIIWQCPLKFNLLILFWPGVTYVFWLAAPPIPVHNLHIALNWALWIGGKTKHTLRLLSWFTVRNDWVLTKPRLCSKWGHFDRA